MLTRNIRKADDYVNGMQCDVLSYNDAARVLMVRTVTGKRLPITPWHDPKRPGPPYFPVRLGYCTTVHKAQGDELDFAIIYLDTPNMPAIGYTALSRVRDSNSYLLGGQLTPEHFVPVTMRWKAVTKPHHRPHGKKDYKDPGQPCEERPLRTCGALQFLKNVLPLVVAGQFALREIGVAAACYNILKNVLANHVAINTICFASIGAGAC